MATTLSKVPAKTAAQVCEGMSLDEEAAALLKDNQSPAEFFDLLIEKDLLPDAIRFLACALPPKEAVRWALRCAREFATAAKNPEPAAALEATEQWLAEPSDANRRAAMDAAQKAQGTAAGLASAAAFFSEGSIAPVDRTAVAPPQGVAGNLAGGSILVASVAAEPEKVREKYRKALEAGRQIAL
jgi:hypothetical protein